MGFIDDWKKLGPGFAIDSAMADLHYKKERFFMNAYCNKALKDIEKSKKKKAEEEARENANCVIDFDPETGNASVKIKNIFSQKEEHHPIKIQDCPKCGERLPLKSVNKDGICTCIKCNADTYIW